MDPFSPGYQWYTPYQFAGNKPIWAKDLDGLEPQLTNNGLVIDSTISFRRWKEGGAVRKEVKTRYNLLIRGNDTTVLSTEEIKDVKKE